MEAAVYLAVQEGSNGGRLLSKLTYFQLLKSFFQ